MSFTEILVTYDNGEWPLVACSAGGSIILHSIMIAAVRIGCIATPVSDLLEGQEREVNSILFANYIHDWVTFIGSCYLLFSGSQRWENGFFMHDIHSRFFAAWTIGYLCVDISYCNFAIGKWDASHKKFFYGYTCFHLIVLIGFSSFLLFDTAPLLVLLGVWGELASVAAIHSQWLIKKGFHFRRPGLFALHEFFKFTLLVMSRLVPLSYFCIASIAFQWHRIVVSGWYLFQLGLGLVAVLFNLVWSYDAAANGYILWRYEIGKRCNCVKRRRTEKPVVVMATPTGSIPLAAAHEQAVIP